MSAPAEAAVRRLEAALEGVPHELADGVEGTPVVQLGRDALRDALVALKDRGGFEQATFVTAIDRFPAAPRFELVHQLRSFASGDRVRVVTRLDEEDAVAPTCVDLWPGAGYMERECFDMFGVRFEGHDTKRLLMPEGYDHHPLRKDFPHQGIEPDRLYREWDRARREGADA